MKPLLSLSTLRGISPNTKGVVLPPERWHLQQVGIVHFGIGAFHRAHQAVYTQDAVAATGDDRWGICGVTQRTAEVKQQLAPQDGLYGVLEGSGPKGQLTIVGSVREVRYPVEELAQITHRIADPEVKVITMTITEKGYRRSSTGGLNLEDPAVVADLGSKAPTTPIGRLVHGLSARAQAGAGAISIISCDNLSSNGRVLRGLVQEFCQASGQSELASWITEHTSFPASMVDRIVPATTESDGERAAAILGLADRGLVVAENFRQWVIEDDFVSDRPMWELGGAQIVSDVEPFEHMKLRILNGSHSALAYLGSLRGYETIAQSVADPTLRNFVEEMIQNDIIPVTPPPPGQDLNAYAESVLARFADPALAHTTKQVAMDGSQKLPLRLLGTLRANLAAGRMPYRNLQAVAAWMTFVSCNAVESSPRSIDDPIADQIVQRVSGVTDPGQIVDGLLGLKSVFGSDLQQRQDVRDALVAGVREQIRHCGALIIP